MAIVTNPNVTGVPLGGGGGGAVDSVNGQTGTVVLDATDVGAIESVNGNTGPTVVLTAADVGALAASAAAISNGHVLGPTSAGILVFSGAGSGANALIYLPGTGSPEEAELLGRSFLVICPTGIKNNGNLNVYGNAGNGNHLYQSPEVTGDRAVRISQSQAQVWDFETVTLTRGVNL